MYTDKKIFLTLTLLFILGSLSMTWAQAGSADAQQTAGNESEESSNAITFSGTTPKKNIVSLDLVSLPRTIIELSYERAFFKNISFHFNPIVTIHTDSPGTLISTRSAFNQNGFNGFGLSGLVGARYWASRSISGFFFGLSLSANYNQYEHASGVNEMNFFVGIYTSAGWRWNWNWFSFAIEGGIGYQQGIVYNQSASFATNETARLVVTPIVTFIGFNVGINF